MAEMTEDWRVGKFGCCDCCCGGDATCCNFLCAVCCAPCSLASAVTGQLGATNKCDWWVICCAGSYGFPPANYSLFRKGYHIKGNQCADCLFASCCPCCMICQMSNEQESRGQRPYTAPNRADPQESWDTHWFNCCQDPCGFCYGCICPCCAFSQLASEYAGVNCCYYCFCGNCILLRYDMRHEYNLRPPMCGLCGECCCLFSYCWGCMYVQMKNEVSTRGPAFMEE